MYQEIHTQSARAGVLYQLNRWLATFVCIRARKVKRSFLLQIQCEIFFVRYNFPYKCVLLEKNENNFFFEA